MLLNGGSEGPNAGLWQMSNVCRHRQAIMLQGSGHLNGPIVCPIHRWTYDTGGQLIGAPHFPQNPCLNLNKAKLENWNGLLFKGPRSANVDLAGMKVAPALDFTGYKLDTSRCTRAITTGRPSSRFIWRITTWGHIIPVSVISSPATT
jgi:phenylpropionate dioxygenase-like ring-hydroxylating dioxygenase large terminal subunit